MPTTHTPRSATTMTSIVASIFTDAKASWTAAQKRRTVYNRTYRELASLSDTDLVDLRISRVDIPRIAKEAANVI